MSYVVSIYVEHQLFQLCSVQLLRKNDTYAYICRTRLYPEQTYEGAEP
jgi:hypothetical protein